MYVILGHQCQSYLLQRTFCPQKIFIPSEQINELSYIRIRDLCRYLKTQAKVGKTNMNEKWTLTITYSFFFKCLVTKRISIKVKVIVNQSQVKVCYLCCRLRLVIITSRRIKTFPCCNTCNNNKVSQWNKGVAFSKDDLWEALCNCIA